MTNKSNESSTVDVVIVGAGAAGCLYAATLAQKGKKVLVLEAGNSWTLGDLVSSQIWARRLKWQGASVEAAGKNPFSHNHGTGSGFGGAALHHFGTWPRLRPDDFRTRSKYGQGLDWPIGYDELRPYYDAIQKEVGISGDAQKEIWRPPGTPYPMPPLKVFAQAKVLARGFEKLGLHTAPLPLIVNSRPYKGRPSCQYDGWCEAGCPIGALANPLVTYFQQAQDAGAEFRAHCNVTRVLTDAKTGNATGVEYFVGEERKEQHAKVVILAASIVQNPRIMLNSASDKHPQGLSNSNGLVGAYITMDALALVYGLFPEDTENHFGVNAGQLLHRGDFVGADRPYGPYQWQIAPSMKPNDLLGIATTRPDLFGQELHEFMRRATKHLASMAGFAGGVAQRDNRVELAQDKDAQGMRKARLFHSFSPNTLALWEHLVAQGRDVMKAAGAMKSDIWSGPPGGSHLIGGTIMGKSSADSVTNSYGRTHQVKNVVLAGSGLFPAGSGTSPTYTLHAVALRSAKHMLARWNDYSI